MNSIFNPRCYMRSLATRQSNLAMSKHVQEAVDILKAAKYDLIILETSGIGQADREIIDHSDVSMYVMTPEYGATTQLEKIAMLDNADLVVINKFDKQGATDAFADVRKTVQRNRRAFAIPLDQMPVFGTTAHRFNDLGTNVFFNELMKKVADASTAQATWDFEPLPAGGAATDSLIPGQRQRYLGEITEAVRD